MQSNFVSPEYMKLQETISKLQKDWSKQISAETYKQGLNTLDVSEHEPVAAKVPKLAESDRYMTWITELATLLKETDPQLDAPLSAIKASLDEQVAERWSKEVIALNHFYFEKFAEEYQVPEWLPQFLAEHAIRPFLMALGQVYMQVVPAASIKGSPDCPVCGEPVRLAQLSGNGEKVIHCTRCETHWQEKRIKCSHCGNEDHESLNTISVEDNRIEQLQVCEKCSGYVKVIDTRTYLSKPAPAILDLQTIHLDYVAQENGYGHADAADDSTN